ncbi:MAG: ATP-binding cassette domain-containing protein [Bradyrhizobium sp.]|nr:ATP-binding cassette domain-containing protein [Bradyrhizobium sp.]
MYESQQQRVAHLQSYIDRFRAKATKAKQAQSRIKMLERMELIAPAHVDNPFHFSFRQPESLPNPLLKMEKVSAGYGERIILDSIKLNLVPGSRIGLLGRNGAGKSTLIKLLAGELQPVSGEIGLAVPDVISIDAKTNYWIALGFMLVSGAILFGLSRSAIGLILQASGQDKIQAGALGFNVTKHKLAAFVVSAFFSGLAGALMVFYMGTASVSTFVDVGVGVQIIIAAVLGGRRTVIGAAIGAIFLIGMGELLRPLGELATLIVSVIALVVILFFPDGFLGIIRGGAKA